MNKQQQINQNIDFFDSLTDEQALSEWKKIKGTWGENPQSSSVVMHAIFDYFLNYRLPFMEARSE